MKRDFKGVFIPAAIWLDEDLSPREVMLIAEIDSLDKGDERGCYASNTYLAGFIKVKPKTVKNILTGLRKRGHITEIHRNGPDRGLRWTGSPYSGSVPKKGPVPKSGRQRPEIGTAASRNRDQICIEVYNETLLLSSKTTIEKIGKKNFEALASLSEEEFRFEMSGDIFLKFAEWLELRKDLKKPLTKIGLKRLVKTLVKFPPGEILRMIDRGIENGYQGLIFREDKKRISNKIKSKDDVEKIKSSII